MVPSARRRIEVDKSEIGTCPISQFEGGFGIRTLSGWSVPLSERISFVLEAMRRTGVKFKEASLGGLAVNPPEC